MPIQKIKAPDELDACAGDILDFLQSQTPPHIIGLSGELGSGKTALTKACARVLGIKDEITSPTFVIMKSYEVKNHARYKTFVHIDAYRIEDEKEMKVIHFDEVLKNPHCLTVIEWPERIPKLLPENTLSVTIELVDQETRAITYGS